MIPPDDDNMIPHLTDAEAGRRLLYFAAVVALLILVLFQVIR